MVFTVRGYDEHDKQHVDVMKKIIENYSSEIVNINNFNLVKINNSNKTDIDIDEYISFYYIPVTDKGKLDLTRASQEKGTIEYYLRLTDDVKNILTLGSLGSEYIFLVLGKKDSIRENGENGDIIYFTGLTNNNDNKNLDPLLQGNLYRKNPDISGGKRKRQTIRNKKIQRKRKTVKRVKMRRTRHRKRVNTRHSKKYKR